MGLGSMVVRVWLREWINLLWSSEWPPLRLLGAAVFSLYITAGHEPWSEP